MAKKAKYAVVLIHSCAGDYIELTTTQKDLEHIKEVFDNKVQVLGEFENMFDAIYLHNQKKDEYKCESLSDPHNKNKK